VEAGPFAARRFDMLDSERVAFSNGSGLIPSVLIALDLIIHGIKANGDMSRKMMPSTGMKSSPERI